MGDAGLRRPADHLGGVDDVPVYLPLVVLHGEQSFLEQEIDSKTEVCIRGCGQDG